MADVTPERRERGQLLLVAALGMAVLFVVLALTLNTAIYTENLATRGSDLAGGREAVDYRAGTEAGVEAVIESSNYHHNESATTLEANLSSGIADLHRLSSIHSAASGRVTNTSLNGHVEGSRIVQSSDRNFTDDEGNSTWIVADQIHGTRSFSMNVSQTALTRTDRPSLFASEVFVITFEGAGDVWNVSVYNETGGPGSITVDVSHAGTKYGPCRVTTQRAVIDITGETVGGTDCPELGYLDNVTGPYAISFNDTLDGSDETVNGTYELVVDEPPSTIKDGQYHDDGSGKQPYLTPAIFSADIRVVYNTTRIQYMSDFRVNPGETLAD